jgi:isoaspartyl peptidase/L-asparaginase-like protein (Ntn-hydrolase superfamily)
MIVVTSQGGEVGIEAAIDILRRGGSALDAVEAATRLVEADQNNHTVGLSGWPPARLAPWACLRADPALPRGTVNVLARDRDGHLAVAVSTSGWAWKYPGRLGDSPIIGAGNYCDDRYGAAACIGVGEWTMRCLTARSIVLYQKLGYTADAACREAVCDLGRLDRGRTPGSVSILALDRHGRLYGATTAPAPRPYTVWEEGMAAPETRLTVPLDMDAL